MTDDLLLAYLAGFFDGEGCVHIGRTSVSPKGITYYRMTVSVAQVDPSPLHLFARRFGGNVTRGSRGAWVWQRVGWQAARVLEALLPFLRQKGEQARLALIYQRMQQTQKRGARPLTTFELAERASFDEAFTAIRHQSYSWEGVAA